MLCKNKQKAATRKMSHRVIAGKAKGRRLKLVPGDTTRPIMDRAKEALFNIIGDALYNTSFLDLFAGTGSVGIEALSRGAAYAKFVDMEPRAIQTIRANLQATQLTAQADVLRTDAFRLLAQPPDRLYDFIYVAPPQYKSLWKRTLQTLESQSEWIPEGTQVIVQIDPKENTLDDLTLQALDLTDERRYGNTLLCFYTSTLPTTTAQDS